MATREFQYEIRGNKYAVKIVRVESQTAVVEVNGNEYLINILPHDQSTPTQPKAEAVPAKVAPSAGLKAAPAGPVAAGMVTAPMPGMVMSIKVQVGQQVERGDVLVVIEAMKMLNEIKAHLAGQVKEILVQEGKNVQTGDPLVLIE